MEESLNVKVRGQPVRSRSPTTIWVSGIELRWVTTGGEHLYLLGHLSLGFIFKPGAWVYFEKGRKRNLSKRETCFYEPGILFAADLEEEKNVKTDKNKTKQKKASEGTEREK